VVGPQVGPVDEVRLGATVVVRDSAGRQSRFQIVGVDEADGKTGRIAFVAPLARALLGRRVGELASVQTPRGEDDLEVVAIIHDDGPA
jgi:transcription elongation factor GreB